MTSSGTSEAIPSTMRMASAVPAITMSIALSAMSAIGGLTANSPSKRPMRTAPIGPENGIFDMCSAADAPLMDMMSGSRSLSAEYTVEQTCTSLRKPLGNKGRIGRSVRRQTSTSRSLGAPFTAEEVARDLACGETLLAVINS